MTSSSGEAHFSSQPHGVPTGPGRFARVDDIDPVEFVLTKGAEQPKGQAWA